MRPLMGPLFKVGAPKSDFFAVSAVGDCPFHDPFVGFHFKLVIRVTLFEGCRDVISQILHRPFR